MKEQKKMSTSSLFSLQFCILFVSGFMLSETYQLKSHYPTTNKIHSLTPIQIRQQDICLYGKGLGSKGSDETFCCQECGVEHIKWVGKCSSCGTWNSVKAFRPTKQIFNPTGSAARRPIPTSWVSSTSSQPSSSFTSSSPMSDQTSSYSTSAGPYSSPPSSSSYNSYSSSAYPAGASTMRPMEGIEVDEAASRIPLFSDELNRVFGGGLVKGSVVLCAGEPGIGKSTLFMQIASYIASRTSNADIRAPVVYVSGEENSDQIVSRARRLRLPTANILLHCEIEVEQIIANIIDLSSKPAVVVVDSVQTMYTSTCTGSSGSVTQIRESTARFIQLAKTYDITVILLGHVTKSGDVAGPRVLEHMVDTVLFMESSESEDHRIVRTMKNR